MRKIDMYHEVPEEFHVRLCNTLENLEDKKTVPFRARKYGIALAAAVLACASLTVGAVKFFQWHPGASQNFGTEKELENKLSAGQVAIPEEDFASGEGLTFQAIQAVRTDQYYYFLVSVTVPEDISWNEDILIEEAEVLAGQERIDCGVGFRGEMDEKRRVLLEIQLYDQDDISFGDTVSVQLKNLVQCEKTEITDTLVEGEWELTFALPQKADTIICQSAQKLPVDGHELLISKTEISPFAIRLYTEELLARHAAAYDNMSLTGIAYADGSIVENGAISLSKAGKSNEEGEFYFELSLAKAVDPEKVEALIFKEGGEEVRFSLQGSGGLETQAQAGSQKNSQNMTTLSELKKELGASAKVSDLHAMHVQYDKVIFTDEEYIYLWDAVCDKAQCLVTLSQTGYSKEAGGAYTMPVGGSIIVIHPTADSDVVINCSISSDSSEWEIWEMPAENLWPVTSSDVYEERIQSITEIWPEADDRYSQDAYKFHDSYYGLYSEDGSMEELELISILIKN